MGKIGEMTRKIELKSLTSTKTSMGAPTKTYTHWKYKMAARTAAGELPESYVNNRLVVAQRWRYRIHDDDDVDETMRVVDDGVEYNILLLVPAGLFLEIVAERVVE
jgi:head-tail adaptor